MSWSPKPMLESIRTRLAANAPVLVTIDSADSLEDALLRGARVPGAYPLIAEAKSEGRRVHNRRDQILEVVISIPLITQTFESKSSSLDDMDVAFQQSKDALVWWTPAGALMPLAFVSFEFFARSSSRVAYDLQVRTRVNDTFTP